MVKDKRFSLGEIIIALLIICAIIWVGLSIINKLSSKPANRDYALFLEKINTATAAYLNNNPKELAPLSLDAGYLRVIVDDLIKEGLLDDNLINPNNGLVLGGTTEDYVLVTFDANGALKYAFRGQTNPEGYMEAQNLVLTYEQDFDCTNIAGYEKEWQTPSLRIISPDGLVNRKIEINDIINRVECNINSSIPRNYTITYLYHLPGSEGIKVYKRTAIVLPSMEDILNLEINVDNLVTVNQILDLNVWAVNRRGEKKELSRGEYSIINGQTNKTGLFTATVIAHQINSDGTIAKQTFNYEVK